MFLITICQDFDSKVSDDKIKGKRVDMIGAVDLSRVEHEVKSDIGVSGQNIYLHQFAIHSINGYIFVCFQAGFERNFKKFKVN